MPVPVLFIIEHLDRGGTEDHFHDLVTGLDPARFQPHVIHFGEPGGAAARRIDRHGAVPIAHIPVGRVYGPAGLGAVAKVRAYLRRHAIRAVVTYHFVADFIGALAAWGLAPVVSSRRDTGFTRTWRQRALAPLLDRGVRRYVAVSEAVRRALIAGERIKPGKIEVIYNGIDAAALAAPRPVAAGHARLGLAEAEVVIVCVANFNPVKNHLVLLEAFARLRSGAAAPPPRLLLAGDGPLRPAIEARVRELGLEGAVLLTGFSEDVAREFQAGDVAVLASSTEGLSNSLLQAMACSRPVVACAVGGNPEVVADGETGLLVAPDDPGVLAEALGRLIGDPALRRRLGEAGARRVRERFSIAAMIAAHERLLETLIARI